MNAATLLASVGVALGLGFLVSLRWTVQPLLRFVLAIRYDLVILGRENIPARGPVLIAANHVGWLDGLFLAAACPRRGQALVNRAYIDWPILGRWARWIGLIPVPFTGPKALRSLFETCRQVLDEGYALGIFPEAQMSRNGLTGRFLRGVEIILAGRSNVAVMPAFLDNIWGSVFSFSGGRFLRKWPRGWRRTVVIAFGPPMGRPITAFSLRQSVLEAGVEAYARRPASARSELETLDPDLPHLDHPNLGRLAGSTADFDSDGIHQQGWKSGTLGLPLPGVALRILDDDGQPSFEPDVRGRLQAKTASRPIWTDTGWEGRIDADGFVSLAGGVRMQPCDGNKTPHEGSG